MNFFNFGIFVKIREFFFAEVTNSRSMPNISRTAEDKNLKLICMWIAGKGY